MSLPTNKTITYNICCHEVADFYIAGYEHKVTDIGLAKEFYPQDWVYDKSAYLDELSQLCDFFDGKRKSFDIDFDIEGDKFKDEVLRSITKIPYGETRSYKEVAIMSGSPNAARAVGNVCRNNRLFLLIPCHRVVASNGIGGYGNCISAKKRLLDLEEENK